jgi:hypothetical protein
MTHGNTQPVLDLSKRAWQKSYGDVTVIGTWTLGNRRPTLALVPTRPKPTHDRVIPCLVPIDLAFAWDEHTGDPGHAAQMSMQFAAALGLNPVEPRNVVKVTMIVREHLGDLLMMPSMPETEREIVADVLLTDTNTGKTREQEIMDDV